MCDSIKFLMKNYLHVQMYGFCGLLLARSATFDPFGLPWDAQGAPKNGQNFLFVLNESQYQISVEKSFLCANMLLLGWGLLLVKWGMLTLFDP